MKEININNIKVTNLIPTKIKFTNKNKKFSAKGYYDGLEVKVYEVFDQNQGNLRAFISNHKDLSQFFPRIISYDKKYIVEEWIKGNTLKEENKRNLENILQSEQVKKIINLMWSVNYHEKVFDYIEYIHNRVNKKNSFDLQNIPNRINHNDLSLDNIILTSKGLKIIDNEFLGYNSGWILNYKNSFLKENYEYRNFISDDVLHELWAIRKEWSKLIKNEKFFYNTNMKNFFKKFF